VSVTHWFFLSVLVADSSIPVGRFGRGENGGPQSGPPILLLFHAGGRPVFELHAEREAARSEDFLDLVERLRPRFGVFSNSFSVRWIRSPM